ncbi:MAG: hypothetical protein ABSG55_01870 [Dehalococcoidia bacterium]|jgi:hypothetical protein
MIEPILAITALAFLSESLTEYLFAAPLSAARLPADVIRYVAVAVGVLLAWTYNVDMTRELLGLTPRPAALGVLLSGVVMGRGASYVHDFYQSYLRPGDDKGATSGT